MSEPTFVEEPHEQYVTRRPKPRRGRWLAGAALVVACAVVAAVIGSGGSGDSGGAAASSIPSSLATVERVTLKDTTSESGELGYGAEYQATSRVVGTVTRVPASGSRLERGDALYWVDERPVTVMYGSTPAYRALRAGDEGEDVRQLEKNLAALGYSGFTVDDDFTTGTAEAVEEWQADLGQNESGVVDLGAVVFTSGAVRVSGVTVVKGAAAAPGAEILTYTGTTQVVTVALDPSDQRLAKKDGKVTVTLPDGATVPGVVSAFSSEVVPADSPDGEDSTQLVVTVKLDGAKAQKAADAYSLATVEVAFTSGTRKDVLAVPVAALVALTEGGFGLEVVKDGSATYVPVETGLFADGRVEVSGPGIAEGDRVGVPA